MPNKEYRLKNDLFDSLIFITVKVGAEDISAMFDTGASISIISQSLAKRLNSVPDQSVTARNNNGKPLTLDIGGLDRIEICGLPIENVKVGILPDNSFDFGFDDAGRTFPAQMLLGWDIISRFSWRIDTKNKLCHVSKCGNKHTNSLSYCNFPTIRLKYKTGFAFFGFDTGHTETLLDKTWYTKLDHLRTIENGWRGVGGSFVEQSFVANHFEFTFEGEKFCLEKVIVLQHSVWGLENKSVVGLLGIDFFKNTIFEIDYGNKHFHIEKAR